MLLVWGNSIESSEDHFLNRHLGYSYQRPEYVNEMIDWYIEQPLLYRFGSTNALIEGIAGLNGSYLIIQRTHPTHPGPYRIIMSGSRTTDYDRANAAAGLTGTPAGYTWHHKEGLTGALPNIRCDMYLIDTAYHSRVDHRGAVYQYELRTGFTYT